jgi:hypothetical protein
LLGAGSEGGESPVLQNWGSNRRTGSRKDQFLGGLGIMAAKVSQSSPRRLECLPQEIVVMIMKLLPDRASLLATMLTCKHFYQTVRNGNYSILLSILLQELPVTVMTDALWCWKVHSLPEEIEEEIDDYVKSFDPKADPNSIFSSICTTAAAVVYYAKLHDNVLYWTSRIHRTMVDCHSSSGSTSLPPIGMSTTERSRIMRALYRFELCSASVKKAEYSSLRQEDPYWEHPILRERFFDRFHAAELEQLRCLYEFFLARVEKDFYAKCEHSVRYGGEIVMPPCDLLERTNERQQYVVSQGLQLLRRIDTEVSERDRCALIPEKDFHSYYHDCFIEPVISWRHPEEWSRSLSWPAEDAISETTYQAAQYQWAVDEHPGLYIYSMELKFLRSWGYCLWDADTLNALGYPSTLCNEAIFCRSHEWYCERSEKLNASVIRTKKSRWVRYLIYARGGTGWWSEGDDCQVDWECGDPKNHYLPGSEPPDWSGLRLEDLPACIDDRELRRLPIWGWILSDVAETELQPSCPASPDHSSSARDCA